MICIGLTDDGIDLMWIDTQASSERELLSHALWQFELLLASISSEFPLANNFDLPGSQSIFGISLDPLLCAHTPLSQDGSLTQRGLWIEHPLTLLPFGDRQGAFLC